jgi:hypothetical protein
VFDEDLMPAISEFYGIVIRMYFMDHAPPYFHAVYGDSEAVIGIRSLELIEGSLPRRAMSFVIEWASQHHREELQEDWELCAAHKSPHPIRPLD